jgi:hypothetical protein
MPMELWSRQKDSESGAVGFVCAHDIMRSVLYAKLTFVGDDSPGGVTAARSTKAAITSLLDVAEAVAASKITLGLSAEHASCADLICSLLYLGFQVMPTRKCPLVDVGLLLDFDIGLPSTGANLLFSDYTCSGTSDCSTAVEDNGSRSSRSSRSSESPDSD